MVVRQPNINMKVLAVFYSGVFKCSGHGGLDYGACFCIFFLRFYGLKRVFSVWNTFRFEPFLVKQSFVTCKGLYTRRVFNRALYFNLYHCTYINQKKSRNDYCNDQFGWLAPCKALLYHRICAFVSFSICDSGIPNAQSDQPYTQQK